MSANDVVNKMIVKNNELFLERAEGIYVAMIRRGSYKNPVFGRTVLRILIYVVLRKSGSE